MSWAPKKRTPHQQEVDQLHLQRKRKRDEEIARHAAATAKYLAAQSNKPKEATRDDQEVY